MKNPFTSVSGIVQIIYSSLSAATGNMLFFLFWGDLNIFYRNMTSDVFGMFKKKKSFLPTMRSEIVVEVRCSF